MPFTGQLGSAQLSSFQLGRFDQEFDVYVGHALTFTQTASYTLNSTFNEDASHTLTLTQVAAATINTSITVAVSNSLTFTQVAGATVSTPIAAGAGSTLSFSQNSQVVRKTPKFKTADNTLTLSQAGIIWGSDVPFTGQLGSAQLGSFQLGAFDSGGGGTEHDVSASHALTFTQTASYTLNSTFNEDASHTLTLTQVAAATVKSTISASASDTLSISQDSEAVKKTPKFETADNTLTFSQSGDETDTPATFEDGSNSLMLTQEADVTSVGGIFVAAASSLTFTQSVGIEHDVASSTSLSLSNTASRQANFTRAVVQSLSFVESVAANVIRNLDASNTLDFTTSYTVPLTIFTNRPISYVRPTARAVVVGPKCDFTLNVPSQSILLRCPEFGDSEAGVGSVNVKRSMTGLTYAYARRSSKRHLKYSFMLGRQKALELEDFLTNHGTEVMRLENHKGEVWFVTCLSQPYEFKANSRWLNDEERIDISLEFEGVKVAG